MHLPYGLVQFCCRRKIYECLLTPNCNQSHGVTYANSINLGFVYWGGGKVLCFLTLCVIIKKKKFHFLWYLSAVQFIVCSLNINSVLLSQCDNKEHFIERIKEMDLEVQRSLVEHIQQVGYMSVFYGWFSDVQCINVIGMQVLYSSAGSRFIPLPGYHLACYINFNFGIFNETSKGTDVLQSTWCHCQGNQGKYRSNHNIIQHMIVIVTMVMLWNSRITFWNAFACIDSQPGSLWCTLPLSSLSLITTFNVFLTYLDIGVMTTLKHWFTLVGFPSLCTLYFNVHSMKWNMIITTIG